MAFALIFFVIFLFAMYALYSLVFSIWKKKNTATAVKNDENWFKRPFLTREHFVSEAFLLLGLILFVGFFEIIWKEYNISVNIYWFYLIMGVVITVFGYFIRSMLSSFYGILGFFSGYFMLVEEYFIAAGIKDIVGMSFVFIFMVMLYCVGQVHYKQKSWKRFGFFYKLIALVGMIIFLFTTTFEDFMYQLETMIQGAGLLTSTPVFILFSLILLGSLGSVVYAYYKKSSSLAETIVSLLFVFIGLALLLFPEGTELYKGSYYDRIFDGLNMRLDEDGLTTLGYLIAAGFNGLLFFFLLGLIGLGYKTHEIWKINLGIIGLFAFIIIKYFDWFFSFMEKSLFFVTAGIIVLAIGFFMEKGRRYMISTLEESK